MAAATLEHLATGMAALAAVTGTARADASPVGVMGDPVIAIGVVIVVVLIIWFVIRGALSLSARDKSDEDEAGVGVLEGIDEDDDKPKRR